MVGDEPLPLGLVFPADDDAEDAEWLASLIQAVRAQVEQAGRPDIADILDQALSAAESAEVVARSKRAPH